MKPIQGWENVKASGDFESLKPGGYVAIIKFVEDDAKKEYLKIQYDIHEGEFKDYYKELYDSMNFWGGTFFRSYKEKATGMFKAFTNSVEESNPRYTWDWNERGLINKLVGIVLQEEEYIPTKGDNAGKVKTRLIVQEVKSVADIRAGKYKVKDKKKLASNTQAEQVMDIQRDFDNALDTFDIKDDDLQF